MSRRKLKAGTTSVAVPLFVQDTTSTSGAGLGALVFNTAGLAAKYRRQGDATWTAITLVTAAVGTWTSGGFVADGGPVTGGYEFGVPDAALAAGARWAEVAIYGAANMLPVLLEFELDAVDYQDAAGFGLSRLDAAVSSRSTYAGADTAGTTTLLTRVTGTLPLASDYTAARAAKLDNLDVVLSTRSTYAGADTAGTTTLLARLTAGRATNLDNLDAAISSRLATSGYTAPPTATAVADAVLSRDVSNVEATAPEHSLCYVVLSASEASVTGTTLTVKRTDGATTFATKTLTVSAGASPVVGVA